MIPYNTLPGSAGKTGIGTPPDTTTKIPENIKMPDWRNKCIPLDIPQIKLWNHALFGTELKWDTVRLGFLLFLMPASLYLQSRGYLK